MNDLSQMKLNYIYSWCEIMHNAAMVKANTARSDHYVHL